MIGYVERLFQSKYKLAAAGVASTYLIYCVYENFCKKDKPLDKRRNNRRYKTRGIRRTNGVTCYLNSIFLILSNSPKFITYLNEIIRKAKDGNGVVLQMHELIFDVLQKLLLDQPDENVSNALYLPREFIHNLELIINHNLLRQNDWLEVLEKVIDVLDAERKRLIKVVGSEIDIPFPFGFESKLVTYCSRCRKSAQLGSQLNRTDTENLFLLINLDFAFKKNEYQKLAFAQLIEQSLYEQIEGYTCSYCTMENYITKTGYNDVKLQNICINTDIKEFYQLDIPSQYFIKTTLIKKREIIKYPSLLFCNLNRFNYNHSGISQRDTDTYFNFGKDIYIEGNVYKLNTLVKHAGNARVGGHYQVFIRKPIVIKTKTADKEVTYDLKYKPLLNNDEHTFSGEQREVDLGNNISKDFWLINDDKVKDKSLLMDINSHDSNMIVGLVFER